MKIKAVCEATGLTDRTVRYYIEENLISPVYTENYLGRKTYDFSQSDITQLEDIATLRKFDFSIDDIRDILRESEKSKEIIRAAKQRAEGVIAEKQSILSALARLDESRLYTAAELASALAAASAEAPVKEETAKRDWEKAVLTAVKTVLLFLTVWLPFGVSGLACILSLRSYKYPTFDPSVIGWTLLTLLPSACALIASKIHVSCRKAIKGVLLALCIFCLPLNFFVPLGLVTQSETTDIRHYRKLDADCIANRNSFFQELFPVWSNTFLQEKQPDGSYKTVSLDSRYYYRYVSGFDYTYDIYAQWPLEKDAFAGEVQRVTKLFQQYAPEERSEYMTVQAGNYTCLIRYHGDPPFEKATDSYTYYIFAYDAEKLTVRYILCDSLQNGAEQPYYLSLDWQ